MSRSRSLSESTRSGSGSGSGSSTESDSESTSSVISYDKKGKEKSIKEDMVVSYGQEEREVSKEGEKSDVVGKGNVPKKAFTGIHNPLGRTGGVYIPPFKLAQMKRLMGEDEVGGEENQKKTWEALRKSINGLVNKVNIANMKYIVPELFEENLVRGRGLFARSIMKAQLASPGFTHIYAALVAIVNTKLPENGELVLKRVIHGFKRAYKRRDKVVATALAKFIAHLVNHQVAHELLALQLLTILLEDPTDDSVEVAVNFVKEVGQLLEELSPRGLHAIFERFRGILHEGDIDKRVQYTIEGLFAIRKGGFADYPAVPKDLDLVEKDDQITFELGLDDEIDKEEILDVYRFDPNFEENEKLWLEIKKEILGDESGSEESGSGDEADESDDEPDNEGAVDEGDTRAIVDLTEQDLVNLRRTLYLTIMSAVSFEECAHKIMKLNIPDGYENELCNMLIECCSNERSYLKYYGLIGQRFCMIHRKYQDACDECFLTQYNTIHRLETNKLRNVAKYFAHLFATDALPWTCLEYIKLNEEDTTSSSRIFIKILMQELSEALGLAALRERFSDPYMQDVFSGLFPRDNPRNTRFAINFFTSIGLGGLTDGLREHLKNAPKLLAQQLQAQQMLAEKRRAEEESSSDSDSSSTSSSSSSGSSTTSSSGSSSSGSSSSSSTSSSSSSGSSVSRSRKYRRRVEDKRRTASSRSRSQTSLRRRSSDRNRGKRRSHSRNREHKIRDAGQNMSRSISKSPSRGIERSQGSVVERGKRRSRRRDRSPSSEGSGEKDGRENCSKSPSRERRRSVDRKRSHNRDGERSAIHSRPKRDRLASRRRDRSPSCEEGDNNGKGNGSRSLPGDKRDAESRQRRLSRDRERRSSDKRDNRVSRKHDRSPSSEVDGIKERASPPPERKRDTDDRRRRRSRDGERSARSSGSGRHSRDSRRRERSPSDTDDEKNGKSSPPRERRRDGDGRRRGRGGDGEHSRSGRVAGGRDGSRNFEEGDNGIRGRNSSRSPSQERSDVNSGGRYRSRDRGRRSRSGRESHKRSRSPNSDDGDGMERSHRQKVR